MEEVSPKAPLCLSLTLHRFPDGPCVPPHPHGKLGPREALALGAYGAIDILKLPPSFGYADKLLKKKLTIDHVSQAMFFYIAFTIRRTQIYFYKQVYIHQIAHAYTIDLLFFFFFFPPFFKNKILFFHPCSSPGMHLVLRPEHPRKSAVRLPPGMAILSALATSAAACEALCCDGTSRLLPCLFYYCCYCLFLSRRHFLDFFSFFLSFC